MPLIAAINASTVAARKKDLLQIYNPPKNITPAETKLEDDVNELFKQAGLQDGFHTNPGPNFIGFLMRDHGDSENVLALDGELPFATKDFGTKADTLRSTIREIDQLVESRGYTLYSCGPAGNGISTSYCPYY